MKGSVTVDIDNCNYVDRPDWLDKGYRPIGGDNEIISVGNGLVTEKITTYWIDGHSIVETYSYRFYNIETTETN